MTSNSVNSDMHSNNNQHSILTQNEVHEENGQSVQFDNTEELYRPQTASFHYPRMVFEQPNNLSSHLSQMSFNTHSNVSSAYISPFSSRYNSSLSTPCSTPYNGPLNPNSPYFSSSGSSNYSYPTTPGHDSGIENSPFNQGGYRRERMPNFIYRFPTRMYPSMPPYDLSKTQSPFWGECQLNYVNPWMYYPTGELFSPNHNRMMNKSRMEHSRPYTIPPFVSCPTSDGCEIARYLPSSNYMLNSPPNDSTRANMNRINRMKSFTDHSKNTLLEDFRNGRLPFLKLGDIKGSVVDFSKDQHGSRFIQQKLEKADEREKDDIFSEISSSIYSLMTDVFGNYVVQKLFEFGSIAHKERLCSHLKGQVLRLTLHMYGCRVVQKSMECVGIEMQVEIANELKGSVIRCVRDQNGNHVIQKCIECFPSLHLDFIICSFKGQVYDLSTHSYGCRVIQRILEHCPEWQTVTVLQELHRNTDKLMKDQYGNYVIQHVILRGKSSDRSSIIKVVEGRLIELSQHKFASNVVEKCIVNALPSERHQLIEEIISDEEGFCALIKDQFGNYVVQKMLDISSDEHRIVMLDIIQANESILKKYTYGKHVLARMDKI